MFFVKTLFLEINVINKKNNESTLEKYEKMFEYLSNCSFLKEKPIFVFIEVVNLL